MNHILLLCAKCFVGSRCRYYVPVTYTQVMLKNNKIKVKNFMSYIKTKLPHNKVYDQIH